jgi:hypothetical protein
MSTSVGTKAKKKQSSLLKTGDAMEFPAEMPEPADKELEMAMLALETVCLMVLENQLSPTPDDIEEMTSQQRLLNIVNPVSLALMECKGGPRHFHYHYRHSPHDDAILQPVLENPVDTLALACRDALKHCHEDRITLHDPDMRQARQAFQQALNGFLAIYANHQSEVDA